MAFFSSKKVEEIKNAADIVDVIGEFVSLQQAGKNMKGLCPFHNEKTPSFFVSKERQIFNCFGCGEKGNVIQFISKYKRIEYHEAIQFLADKYGIEPDRKDSIKKNDSTERLYRINELAKQFFSLQLLNLESGNDALNYLKSRGFDEEILSYFELGFAPKSGNQLWENLTKNFHDYELIEAGLIGKNQSDYYDIFRNKVMFPIRDETGKTVGFSGRIFNNEENTAKYVNSTQTEVFTKSELLYNLDKAIPFINQNKRLVLMEGFFDVMSAYKADIKEAVCSMGTALTIQHANLIKRYTDNVVICYDGDEAGIKAAYKALVLLGQVGLDTKVALLPEKLDPDDYIKKYSKESFRNVLKNNLYDQYDFVYEMIVSRKDLTKPAEIEKAKLALFEYLDKVASSTIREIYLKKFSNDTKVDYQDILADYHNFQLENRRRQSINQRKVAITKAQTEVRLTKKNVEAATDKLLNYYALYEEARTLIRNKLDLIRIDNHRKNQLLMTLTQLLANDNLLNEMMVKADFSEITEEELQLLRKTPASYYNETEVIDCIETLILNRYEHEYEKNLLLQDDPNLPIEEKNKAVLKIMEIRKNINNIREKRHVKKTNNHR